MARRRAKTFPQLTPAAEAALAAEALRRADREVSWLRFDIHSWSSSRSVKRMSGPRRRLYLDLLVEQFVAGSLPADADELVALLDVDTGHFHDHWPALSALFPVVEGGERKNARALEERQRAVSLLAQHIEGGLRSVWSRRGTWPSGLQMPECLAGQLLPTLGNTVANGVAKSAANGVGNGVSLFKSSLFSSTWEEVQEEGRAEQLRNWHREAVLTWKADHRNAWKGAAAMAHYRAMLEDDARTLRAGAKLLLWLYRHYRPTAPDFDWRPLCATPKGLREHWDQIEALAATAALTDSEAPVRANDADHAQAPDGRWAPPKE